MALFASPAPAFAPPPVPAGWLAAAVRYLGGHGAPWFVELRDGSGRRVAEGEGDTEAEALAAALAAALVGVGAA